MSYRTRRAVRAVVYVLCALLALPPGFGTQVLMAASRTSTMTRDAAMETFRNPQFTSGLVNRFLYTHMATDMVSGGGEGLLSPESRGYGAGDAPETLWLPTGQVEWGSVDLSLPGVGLPLVFDRIWRGSVTDYDGPLGREWEFGWNRRLYEEEDDDVVFYDRGRTETYDEDTGSYTSPAGRYDVLAKDTGPNPDVFTRTDKFGVVETYTDEGSGWYRLTGVTDTNDNTLTFLYDGNSKLTKVTDTLSQDTTLAYDGNGRITAITDHGSRSWAYAYDGGGRLISVTNPVSAVTAYAYDGSDRLTSVALPEDGSPSRTFAYDGSGRVTTHGLNGNTFEIVYDLGNSRVTVTDRVGEDIIYILDNDDRVVTRHMPPSGGGSSYSTFYSYNADNEVTLVQFPGGSQIAYTYDGDGNITTLQHRQDSSDTTSPVQWLYTYTSLNRVSTLTDPNGNTWDYNYDADGNLTQKTAPAVTVPSGVASTDNNGNGTYDGTIVTSYAYHASGLLTRMTDPVGTITDYEYTSVNAKNAYLHKVKRDTDSGGLTLVTQYDYDGVGNQTKVTDAEARETKYFPDALGRVTQAIEPLAVTRTTTYDDNNRVTETTVTNDTDVGNGVFTVTHEYDGANHLVRTIADVDASNRLTTTYAYDASDRLTSVLTPEGRETRYGYDTRGMRNAVTREAGGSDPITTTTFDRDGLRVTVTDELGNATLHQYDKLGRLTKTLDPATHYRTLAYDKAGNLTKVSVYEEAGANDLKLAETVTSFDQANRVYQTEQMAKKADLSTDIGDGQQTKVVWRDEMGRVLESSGDVCGCAAYAFVYDAVGRRITVTDPMPGGEETVKVSEYDKAGNVTKLTVSEQSQDTGIEADKDLITLMVYDARDRVVTRRERLTGTPTYADTLYLYGKRDQLTKVTDPEGREALTEYDEQLRKTEESLVTAGDDVVTQYFYDDDGHLLTYRAINGTTGNQDTTYAYDLLGRVVGTTWPDAGTTIQTYDAAGNRISTTDPNGTVTVCAYDSRNLLTAKDMPLVGAVLGATAIDYTYDGMGRMKSADLVEGVSFSSVLEWTYNTLGKVQTEKQVLDGYNSGNGRTITYDWNVDGQKTGVTYPISGNVISYVRDDLDRVDKISKGGAELVDYAFNGARVIEKAYPGSEAEYTYDGYGRLSQIHHKDSSSGNTLAKFVYGFDKSHRVTSQDKLYYDDVQNTRLTDDTEDVGDQYAYDGAGRLVTVLRGVPSAEIDTAIATNISNNDYDELVEYVYDPTGNRTTLKVDGSPTVTYAHNAVNEMVTENGVTLTYDDNGNYTGAGNEFQYSHKNQLAKRTAGGGWDSWHHDALGRAVQAKDQSGRVGRNYYDGQHRVETANFAASTETHQKQFVYGETIDEILYYKNLVPNPDEEHFYHADRLGSVQVVVEDDGSIAESYRHDAWGVHEVVDDTFAKVGQQTGIGNPWRYTARGYANDASPSGQQWYDYRARHYRADAGRFVQRDTTENNEYLTQGGLGMPPFPALGFGPRVDGAHSTPKKHPGGGGGTFGPPSDYGPPLGFLPGQLTVNAQCPVIIASPCFYLFGGYPSNITFTWVAPPNVSYTCIVPPGVPPMVCTSKICETGVNICLPSGNVVGQLCRLRLLCIKHTLIGGVVINKSIPMHWTCNSCPGSGGASAPAYGY